MPATAFADADVKNYECSVLNKAGDVRSFSAIAGVPNRQRHHKTIIEDLNTYHL